MRATAVGIVAVTAAVCASVAACSGSSKVSGAGSVKSSSASSGSGAAAGTITTTEWNSRVNAICDKSNKASSDLGDPPSDPTDTSAAALTAMATYFDKQSAILKDEVKQVRALPPAAPVNTKAQAALSDLDKGIAGLDDSTKAARSGDATTFLTKFSAASTSFDDASSMATDAGLTSCGQQ